MSRPTYYAFTCIVHPEVDQRIRLVAEHTSTPIRRVAKFCLYAACIWTPSAPIRCAPRPGPRLKTVTPVLPLRTARAVASVCRSRFYSQVYNMVEWGLFFQEATVLWLTERRRDVLAEVELAMYREVVEVKPCLIPVALPGRAHRISPSK